MFSLRGILLDIDGTLVDSNDAHAHAWIDALAEQGIRVPFEKIRKLIGMGGDKLLPIVAAIEEHSSDGQRVSKRRREIFQNKYLPAVQPTLGAQELIVHLMTQGYPLVAATSAKQDEVGPLLRICGGDRLVDLATSSDDARASKPDPDIVQSALHLAGLNSREVLMLGDTPYDIAAAGKAEVGVIALRCGGWRDQQLEGAIAIYDHPADLLSRFESSPLGRNKLRA